ncbi:hypothetical protein EPUS_05490 [Endocarpon pusillum Z07020]|uniref:Uncharacterized protein n=1 Tax=Endocarpon pusillum (strain Z07020 / HMAS-L-300199) TaxID=1263415 RepID=U1GDZ9_ENDPU|nr:uncharacterized protein EPUS_05490 [Endocarpon pusillum Z07020]ERF69946.1 hypothetical protein EPUS_05490 [Endocarpon pusillum Z07020]
MGGHQGKGLIGQRASLLLLSAILSVSTAILPQASADDTSVSHEQTRNQKDDVDTTSSTASHVRTMKSKSRLPVWAYNPPPAGLDHNLHQDIFAQVLRLEHTPPPVNDPSELANEISNDDEDDYDDDDDNDDDDQHNPHMTDPNHQPVPTKWLMLGYSRVVDIPTSPTSVTMGSAGQGHCWSSSPPAALLDSAVKTTGAPCDTLRTSQTDWMQKPSAQVLGDLIIFLTFVIITQSVIHLWRGYCRVRAAIAGRGELTLEGDEKQFRACNEDIESRSESRLLN